MGKTNIKRVYLNNKSRKGAYFRVYNTQSRRTAYYKIRKALGVTRKSDALFKFQQRTKRISIKKSGLEGTELARLHFRIDYGNAKSKYHQFFMNDSYIVAEVPKKATDAQIHSILGETFREGFKQTFGEPLSHEIEADLVSGIERNVSESPKIKMKYRHSTQNFKEATLSLDQIKGEKEARRKFFSSRGMWSK